MPEPNKSLRAAAEAALEFLPSGNYLELSLKPKAVHVTEDLRAALADPDPMAEACEIIKELVSVIHSAELYSPTANRAREFLKRMEGT